MRTLKKALCLVLVLSMLAGFGVIGASAAYADADKIEYQEAVDVMSAIGVMQGVGDNTFDPNGTFTRAQAAKMLSYMILGETAAEALPARSDFTDVSADQWFSKYIGFGVSEGYLAGMGDGSFKPDDPVTGYQWAKMLLCALGYDAKTEGFEGNGYEINVAKYALTTVKLFEGNEGADYNKNATREEAALYAFNTLMKPIVEYKGTTTVVINGVEVTMGTGKAEAVTTTDKDKVYNTNEVEFAERYMGSKIVKTAAKTDDFGRPASTWKYNNKEVGTYAVAADLTYTTQVTGKTLNADLGKPDSVDVQVYVNGTAWGASNAKVESQITSKATTDAIMDNSNNTYTGNGVLTEVYETADDTYTIVVIDTYYGTISNVKAATEDTKETVTIDCDGNAADGKTFEIAGLKVKDSVIFTYNEKTGKVASVAKVNAITVTPNSINSTAGSFTAGGTTYKYSENIAAGQKLIKFDTVNIYLDSYGYVIATSAVESASSYAVFLKSNTVSNWPEADRIDAQVVLADGTVTILQNVKSVNDMAEGDIVTYADGTGDDAGKIILTEVAAGTPADATGSQSAGSAAITKGIVSFKLGSTDLKADSKTIFVVKTVKDGTASYAAYVGISNVPSITASTDSAYYNKAADGYVDIVYVDTATLKEGASTADTVVYVDASSKVQYNDSEKGEYSVYNAIVDGKITTIETTKDLISADGIYGKVTTNDKGLISKVEALSGDGIVLETTGKTGTTAASNGIVKFENVELTYTEGTVVYKVTDDGITASSIADIGDDANDTVVYYTTNGVLTAAYITVND